jgi:hypothetical protein
MDGQDRQDRNGKTDVAVNQGVYQNERLLETVATRS